MGNPVREVQYDSDSLKQWIAKNADGLEVDVEPMVVFLNPAMELDARNPDVTPVRAKAIKDALRRGEGGGLTGESYRSLTTAFDAAASAAGATSEADKPKVEEKAKGNGKPKPKAK